MLSDGSQTQADFTAAMARREDWARTYAFNFLPLGYVDQTRLPSTLQTATIEAAATSRSVAGHLNKYLLEEFDLIGKWVTAFDDAVSRALALMPSSIFVEIVRFLGLCSAGQSIRNLMTPNDIRQCKDRIGTREFDFVLNKSPLIAPQKILPDTGISIVDLTNDNLMASGAAIVGCAMTSEPNALKSRLALKLPKDITLDADGITLSGPVASGLVKRVIREVAPQWHSA
ncbi:SctK family type III secretion system sorting platform protein [Thalassospira sp.]|uniref:SctK family type III secretion system sorting platform protein n=1 Tax=Thalassospira sp. TaxID=1912094 RepID=UPI000C688EB6|nr:SctK family type III secretion system sorting platform protein [Thalassospira sp.]MBC05416.1 hypothetical protein [Thalassospira sp.]|tara:strand:- start:15648 stop:16334 length:687 start_codon:yes stop_codon:yes gene_type:complete